MARKANCKAYSRKDQHLKDIANQPDLLRRNIGEVREAVRTTTPVTMAQVIAHCRAYRSKLILLLDWNTPLIQLIFLPMTFTVFKQ